MERARAERKRREKWEGKIGDILSQVATYKCAGAEVPIAVSAVDAEARKRVGRSAKQGEWSPVKSPQMGP